MYSGVENTDARCVCTGAALMAGGASCCTLALSRNRNFTGPWGEVSPVAQGGRSGVSLGVVGGEGGMGVPPPQGVHFVEQRCC